MDLGKEMSSAVRGFLRSSFDADFSSIVDPAFSGVAAKVAVRLTGLRYHGHALGLTCFRQGSPLFDRPEGFKSRRRLII